MIRFLLVVAFVCTFALPASAFLPDDGELSMKLRKAYGPLTSWEAVMSFPDYPGVTAHLWYARGKWRQEWKAGERSVAVGMNGNVTAQCTSTEFPLSPMFVWMVPNPVQTWKSWGMDNATRVFGFCDGQPCYQFGSEYGDEVSPTVHLNNETMAPLLVRYISGADVTSVAYSDYRTLAGFRLPQSVVVTMGSEVLTAKVKWIAVNGADDEMLYARDALDGAPCVEPPAPFDILRQSFRYPEVR